MRNEYYRMYWKKKMAAETAEERKERRAKNLMRREYFRNRWEKILAAETDEERKERLAKNSVSCKRWREENDPRYVPGFFRFGLSGDQNGNAKLTPEQVLSIKRRGKAKALSEKKIAALASKHGVSKAAICNIISGRTWKWLNGKHDLNRYEKAKKERERRTSKNIKLRESDS